MEGPPVATRLTRREREIANLIALGYTNRQIGAELSIKERTAGAHVQNILNKLGAVNRAQIAAWSAHKVPSPRQAPIELPESRDAVLSLPPAATPQARSRRGPIAIGGLLALLAILIAAAGDGQRATFAPPAALVRPAGSPAYEAKLSGDGEGFGMRYVLGDPTASEIRFMNGAVEFAVVKPGGNTGDNLAMESMQRYYADADLAVKPGSNVEFWIDLGTHNDANIGDHIVDLQTASELLQLQYLNFVDNKGGLPLGPQVHVKGLQSGRTFSVAALVDPPVYQVFLDGVRVISLTHSPSAKFQQISFAIFGEGGTVRLTSMRVYQLT